METLPTKDKIKSIILEAVAKEKPENTEKLKQIMLRQHLVSPESTTQLIIELENEGKLHFTSPEILMPTSAKEYVFSQKALWFWGVMALSIATAISVFTIPEGVYPLAYVRNALGIVFVLFLPGYGFIKALFPTTVPIATGSESLDNIERIALSLGMSLAIVPIIGLILNYTPWGIRLTPITLSLLGLTTIFAIAAVIREHQTKNSQSENRF